jgi:hypothetical protein
MINIWVQANLTGWRRTRDDLLGGAGVDGSVAGLGGFVDAGDIGTVEMGGEVDLVGIGFRNFRFLHWTTPLSILTKYDLFLFCS